MNNTKPSLGSLDATRVYYGHVSAILYFSQASKRFFIAAFFWNTRVALVFPRESRVDRHKHLVSEVCGRLWLRGAVDASSA